MFVTQEGPALNTALVYSPSSEGGAEVHNQTKALSDGFRVWGLVRS